MEASVSIVDTLLGRITSSHIYKLSFTFILIVLFRVSDQAYLATPVSVRVTKTQHPDENRKKTLLATYFC